MQFESFLEKITTPASPENVLVCEASYMGLRAVVVDKKGDKLTASCEADSERLELNEAVAEVVQKVRQQGWNGQHAIVVSPAACLTVLNLNLPANNKLQMQQIAETIQWEFEPAYNQYKNILSISQIMQVQGVLTASQADEILRQQNILLDSKSSAVEYRRFGELAVSAGYMKKIQLEDALARQRWFASEGDSVKCGWHALPWQPLADMGEYKWLAVGVKQDLLREWQAAFTAVEVKLETIYPVAGVLAHHPIDVKATPKAQSIEAVVVALHQGVMSAVAVSNHVPMQIQTMPCNAETLLGDINELLSGLGDVDEVPISLIDCLSENEHASNHLATDIENILTRPIERLPLLAGKMSLPMRNAAKHFMRVKEVAHVEGVSVYDYLPSVMQRFSTRAILAGMLVIGLMVLSEIGVFTSRLWIENKIANISEDVGRIRSEIERINTKISTIKTLEQEIQQKEANKKNASTMITLLTKELPERNQTLTTLMEKLQVSMTEDVVINSITENTMLGFDFDVWTLSDQAAQAFVKDFQLAIHPMNFRVKNLTVSEGTGRLGLLGYSMRFSITTHSEEEWARRITLPKPRY
jgi:hypothetical protein